MDGIENPARVGDLIDESRRAERLDGGLHDGTPSCCRVAEFARILTVTAEFLRIPARFETSAGGFRRRNRTSIIQVVQNLIFSTRGEACDENYC